MTIAIRRLARADVDAWLALRLELWPHGAADEHRRELREMLATPRRLAAFGAWDDGALAGFAELSVRDIVDGTDVHPCGFLEGLYVTPARRRRGLARALVAAGEAWLAGQGVAALGSDTPIGNEASIAVHRALGFAETERVVQFVKPLR